MVVLVLASACSHSSITGPFSLYSFVPCNTELKEVPVLTMNIPNSPAPPGTPKLT
jgi:hypothetical protein